MCNKIVKSRSRRVNTDGEGVRGGGEKGEEGERRGKRRNVGQDKRL